MINILVLNWRSVPFSCSLLSILGILLVLAPFVLIQPSLWPSESGLFWYASSIYSSSSACVTTIISTSTTSHSLLPPYPTCFARGLFGAGLWSNSLHSSGYGRLWSHLPYFVYLLWTFLLSCIQTPLILMLELFWSRLSGLLPFLATNFGYRMQLLHLRLWALGHISGLLVVALLFIWGVDHGSLHRPLTIGPFVHLAIAHPLVDMLAGEIGIVLAGHPVYLGSGQCSGRLFITA